MNAGMSPGVASRSKTRDEPNRLGGLYPGLNRDGKAKFSPSRAGFDQFDSPPVHLGYATGDGQPKAGSTRLGIVVANTGGVHLEEPLENPRPGVVWDSRSGIDHGDVALAVPPCHPH